MIGSYRDEYCEALIEIWFAASQVATPFLSDDFLAEERDNIRKIFLPKAETWVFQSDDTVAGFIALIGNEVGGIFVHPKFQGRGIGRALMDHAVGLRGSLTLDVFKENLMGRHFYDRYGFRLDREIAHEQTGRSQLRLVYTPNDSAHPTPKG